MFLESSYERTIEKLLMFAMTGSPKIKATPSYSHEREGLILYISFVSSETGEGITRYEHPIKSNDDFKSFNVISERVFGILCLGKHKPRLVMVCGNCQAVQFVGSSKKRLCQKCLLAIPGLDAYHLNIAGRHDSYVYLIINRGTGALKIGQSKNPEMRVKSLQTGNDSMLILVCYIPGSKRVEKEIHKAFGHLVINGEWFKPDQEIFEYFIEAVSKWSSKKIRERCIEELNNFMESMV